MWSHGTLLNSKIINEVGAWQIHPRQVFTTVIYITYGLTRRMQIRPKRPFPPFRLLLRALEPTRLMKNGQPTRPPFLPIPDMLPNSIHVCERRHRCGLGDGKIPLSPPSTVCFARLGIRRCSIIVFSALARHFLLLKSNIQLFLICSLLEPCLQWTLPLHQSEYKTCAGIGCWYGYTMWVGGGSEVKTFDFIWHRTVRRTLLPGRVNNLSARTGTSWYSRTQVPGSLCI